jgi:hypothetical protein
LSNLPFLFLGVRGLWLVLGPEGRLLVFTSEAERLCWLVLFASIASVSVGSA